MGIGTHMEMMKNEFAKNVQMTEANKSEYVSSHKHNTIPVAKTFLAITNRLKSFCTSLTL